METRGSLDARADGLLGNFEIVLHLDDASRQWASWGWPSLHRIVLYGSGVGQGHLAPREVREALPIAHLLAAAPRLAEALRRLLNELPTRRDWLDPSLEAEARAALAALSPTTPE